MWGQLPNRLDHVWSCKTCWRLDDTHLPYVQFFLLQGHDDYDMWYVIWKHRGSMCNVVESKQGDGQ
jgi:hypothetical protein